MGIPKNSRELINSGDFRQTAPRLHDIPQKAPHGTEHQTNPCGWHRWLSCTAQPATCRPHRTLGHSQVHSACPHPLPGLDSTGSEHAPRTSRPALGPLSTAMPGTSDKSTGHPPLCFLLCGVGIVLLPRLWATVVSPYMKSTWSCMCLPVWPVSCPISHSCQEFVLPFRATLSL